MKDAAVIVGVLVELNPVTHYCSTEWFDLFIYFFKRFYIYLKMSINSIPNCLFVFPPFVSFSCVQELGGRGGDRKKFIVPAWFPIFYFSLGEKANLQ